MSSASIGASDYAALSVRQIRRVPSLDYATILRTGDLILVTGAMLATQVLIGTIGTSPTRPLIWVLLLAAIWVALTRAFDAYDVQLVKRRGLGLSRLTIVGALTLAVYALIPLGSPPVLRTGWPLPLNAALMVGLLFVWRFGFERALVRSASVNLSTNYSPALPDALHGPSGPYEDVRRVIDVIVALLGLVLLLPFLAAAAVAIIFDSPGSPLYFQQRVGRYGRHFRLLKLRTMRSNAEADGRAVWARSRDPRVTRVGGLLRRYHIDEIPQFWNVLTGDMALIGPRPERPEFVNLLRDELPLYNVRHTVRPGITGWAQVQFKYAASVREASIKLQYDLYYLRHRSATLDAAIVAKTLTVILRSEGF
jgi:lipopolysaccharide/colanic/teichoic acid biosynthesis glycosyltransferase